jgi:hypothetical protein
VRPQRRIAGERDRRIRRRSNNAHDRLAPT